VAVEASNSKSSKFAQGNFKLSKKGQMGVRARVVPGSFTSGAGNGDQKRGSALTANELDLTNSNFNLKNLNIKNDDLIILVKVYQ